MARWRITLGGERYRCMARRDLMTVGIRRRDAADSDGGCSSAYLHHRAGRQEPPPSLHMFSRFPAHGPGAATSVHGHSLAVQQDRYSFVARPHVITVLPLHGTGLRDTQGASGLAPEGNEKGANLVMYRRLLDWST
jgi:hypothetical protein